VSSVAAQPTGGGTPGRARRGETWAYTRSASRNGAEGEKCEENGTSLISTTQNDLREDAIDKIGETRG